MGAVVLATGSAEEGEALGSGGGQRRALAAGPGHRRDAQSHVLHGVEAQLGGDLEVAAQGEADERDVRLDLHPHPHPLLGELVGVGRGHPYVEAAEVLERARQHQAAAVEVRRVAVRHDLPGA